MHFPPIRSAEKAKEPEPVEGVNNQPKSNYFEKYFEENIRYVAQMQNKKRVYHKQVKKVVRLAPLMEANN